MKLGPANLIWYRLVRGHADLDTEQQLVLICPDRHKTKIKPKESNPGTIKQIVTDLLALWGHHSNGVTFYCLKCGQRERREKKKQLRAKERLSNQKENPSQ